MLLPILLGIVLVVTALILGYTYGDTGSWLFTGAIIWLFTSFLIVPGIVNNFNTYDTDRQELASIQDGTQSTNGQFYFLGSGYINTDSMYTYYIRHPEGYATQEQIKATGVKVFDNSDEAYLLRRGGCHNSLEWLVPCNWMTQENNDPIVLEIHVPRGSIIENTTLDAK